MNGRSLCRLVLFLSILLGGMQVVQGGWIYVKAGLAQWLLLQAWEQSVQLGRPIKPWFWADITPRLRLYLPRQGIRAIVLQGDHGQALAFGPGYSIASALPGTRGTTLISGHRDTHFSFLNHVRKGDYVEIERIDGLKLVYQIKLTEVVHENEVVLTQNGKNHLLLATCWPFNASVSGGPWRFVVIAEPISSGTGATFRLTELD